MLKGLPGERPMRATSAPPVSVYGGPQATTFAAALQDFVDGARRHQFWHDLAWNDVRARYRRSWLGEFWMAINGTANKANRNIRRSKRRTRPMINRQKA
jgi:hypothetical protein